MARHGLGEGDLRALGKKIVRSADIESLLDRSGTAAPGDPASQRLSRSQLAVADAVSRSHRTIPAAYCVAKVEADAALAYLDGLSRDLGQTVGLPELLIKSIASAHREFPLFFARLGDDGTVVTADAPRVGITVDVGTGLSVPVIADADRAPLPSLASALADLRGKALRGRLREADLRDGNIALALNDDESIVAAVPIIQPGHVSMLTCCSIQAEVRLDGHGLPFRGRYFHLGLAYDHRLLNGREAALFLRAVKAGVEEPERLEQNPAQSKRIGAAAVRS
jgi:2-oxoglutarate dehydrogenase E2 component (dihydrolipoamide succinyltransferase)